VVAPAAFSQRQCAKTLCNRTHGQNKSETSLKGRIFEVNLADLMDGGENYSHRKVRLRVDDIQGRNCITNFHGLTLTSDKLKSLVKKWCTLIDCRAVVKTTDGHVLAVFMIAFTEKDKSGHLRKNCYAQTNQVRAIRQKMVEIITKELEKVDLQAAVKKFTQESIGNEVKKQCQRIYPLRDCMVRKVKMVRIPKFELAKLLEAHGNDIPKSREGTGSATAVAVAVDDEKAAE